MRLCQKPSFLKGQITELLPKKRTSLKQCMEFPPLNFSMLADEGGPPKKARRTSPDSAPALGAALDRVDAAYVAQQAQVAGNFLVVHDVLRAGVCETVLRDVLALHQPQVVSFPPPILREFSSLHAPPAVCLNVAHFPSFFLTIFLAHIHRGAGAGV